MKINTLKMAVATIAAAICVSASAGVGVEHKTIHSEILGADRDYCVVLPESYNQDTERTYPVVYLLHGMYDDTPACWVEKGALTEVLNRLVGSGEAREMIVVTPLAGGDYYKGEHNGYFNMDDWAYEDFFFNEFLPEIESNYRTQGPEGNRAIGGLSMGGGGSVVYAQKHPDMFRSVYAMSGLVSVGDHRVIPSEGGNSVGNRLIADFNKSAVENDPVPFLINADAQTLDALRSIAWYADCGDDDFLLDSNTTWYRTMRDKKIPAQLRVRDGAHDWEYWHTALYTALPFFSRNFK